jgi:hypothetical protein
MLYTPIDPDWLSPVIPIEARFYEQSEGDSPGSFYILPSMLTWTPHGEIEHFRDYRNLVMINEIVGNPNGTDGNTGAPEWIEIYNGSPYNVNLYGWRVSISNSSSVDLGITAGTTALATQSLPPGGYLVLAYYITGQAAGDAGLVDTNLADGSGRVHVEFGLSRHDYGHGCSAIVFGRKQYHCRLCSVHYHNVQHLADRAFGCCERRHLDVRRLRVWNGLAAPHSKRNRYKSNVGLVWQYHPSRSAHSGRSKLGHTCEKTIPIRSPFERTGRGSGGAETHSAEYSQEGKSGNKTRNQTGSKTGSEARGETGCEAGSQARAAGTGDAKASRQT